MSSSLSHWYPGSGVVLDLSIPDLSPLSYFYHKEQLLIWLRGGDPNGSENVMPFMK